jgi:hypothetical protein
MKKTIIILITALLSLSNYAQHDIDRAQLRTATLKSDVIFASNSYHSTENCINDYTVEQFYLINRIDSLITNETRFQINEKIQIRTFLDKYSHWWQKDAVEAIQLLKTKDGGTEQRYSDLFFLKKEGKQYRLLGIVEQVKWNDITDYYIPTVLKIKEIDKTNNLNERYTRTLDWFIENDCYPDENFIRFYEQKSIIKGDIPLTDEQLQKAKTKFMNGAKELLPLIEDKFATEINAYYLAKLKKIRQLSKPQYSDYYDFRDIIYKLKGEDFFHYGSVDYIMYYMLTSDTVEKYDKNTIMDYFIKMAEQDLNEEQK